MNKSSGGPLPLQQPILFPSITIHQLLYTDEVANALVIPLELGVTMGGGDCRSDGSHTGVVARRSGVAAAAALAGAPAAVNSQSLYKNPICETRI
ncbi:hypothetical protein EVAR_32022_1 [Eumeta japonica]|uniref:Uncharacterized protein n=1 Tax=Eumeta variegata TaxID=151549 RepID=A0A4C1YNE3_EUMVA|nr:hypothetical protein EVAR_32022_1 [Eumeta japonica]